MPSPQSEWSFDHILHQTPRNQLPLPPFQSLFTETSTPSSSSLDDDSNSTMRSNVIDLTQDTSPPRSRSSRSSEEPARKRRRVGRESSEASSLQGTSQSTADRANMEFVTIDEDTDSDVVEEVFDLSTVNNEDDLKKMQEEHRVREAEKQRARIQLDALASQAGDGKETATLANFSCIICMDNVTNLTATHCGHLFCHECLIQALQAGENNSDNNSKGAKCPVCRKPVSRTVKPNSKSLPQVIPLEIKVRKKSDKAKGKERAQPVTSKA